MWGCVKGAKLRQVAQELARHSSPMFISAATPTSNCSARRVPWMPCLPSKPHGPMLLLWRLRGLRILPSTAEPHTSPNAQLCAKVADVEHYLLERRPSRSAHRSVGGGQAVTMPPRNDAPPALVDPWRFIGVHFRSPPGTHTRRTRKEAPAARWRHEEAYNPFCARSCGSRLAPSARRPS
jgi:hypothetical protein